MYVQTQVIVIKLTQRIYLGLWLSVVITLKLINVRCYTLNMLTVNKLKRKNTFPFFYFVILKTIFFLA